MNTSNEQHPSSFELMPQPFAWIEIPNKDYSIAKYPVTNAQFAKFIEAGGYNQDRWWTKHGWKVCQEGWHYDDGWKRSGTPWTEPRYWQDNKWNGAEQPIVGVSWFESVAFCLWLCDVTGEKIMLPTKEQWQYAAQGDDGRIYPWGNTWDRDLCNNNVDYEGIGKTTPVQKYEGKGDSPFGVVDMVGNVWEWCLTAAWLIEPNNYDHNLTGDRIVRGGSWGNIETEDFHWRFRDEFHSLSRLNYIGFRCARA